MSEEKILAAHKRWLIENNQECICKQAESERDSLVPVFCNNCNAYVKRNVIKI
jgi:hypothetical protein